MLMSVVPRDVLKSCDVASVLDCVFQAPCLCSQVVQSTQFEISRVWDNLCVVIKGGIVEFYAFFLFYQNYDSR